MDNATLAGLLYELGTLIGRSDVDGRRFRAQAYQRAAESIAALDRPAASLDDAQLAAVTGVGPGVAARVREAVTTGRIRRLDELRARDPAGAEALLRVPGLGPRSVARLRDALGVTDLDGLRTAVAQGTLRTVRGFGPTTEARLRKTLASLELDRDRPATPLADAVPLASRTAAALRRVPGVTDAQWTGALRRFAPTVERIELLASADRKSDAATAVATLPLLRPGAAVHDRCGYVTVEGATHDGPPLVVHLAGPAGVSAALLWTTADDAHRRGITDRATDRGLRLDAVGLHTRDGVVTDEDAVHRALGLQAIPPERREGRAVIDEAMAGRLPATAEVEDLRGDLHDHTDWSGDGRMTMDDLVAAARQRGWAYLAVTDHAEDLRMNGLDRAAMVAQRAELRALRRRYDDLALLHGAELNIGPDGGLDYDPDFLAGYDWSVASVHSHFGLDPAAQTRRLVAAARNPAVRALGHLSGRRIGRRPGIIFDVAAVLDACRETGTALEINCHLDRLDATDDVLREAAARGVLTVISTDAHRLSDLDHHRWGVAWARRGGVPRDLVANTWPVARFLEWSRAAL